MKLDEAEPFLYPVDGKIFPEYYQIIKHPMDLSTLKEKIPSYETKEDFLDDAALIASNCATFNAPESAIVEAANNIVAEIKELVTVIIYPFFLVLYHLSSIYPSLLFSFFNLLRRSSVRMRKKIKRKSKRKPRKLQRMILIKNYIKD